VLRDETIILFWGELHGRAGWWLHVPGERLRAIYGPVQCTSAGGGALVALEMVRELDDLRFFYDQIRIDTAPHLTVDDQRCADPTCFGHDSTTAMT